LNFEFFIILEIMDRNPWISWRKSFCFISSLWLQGKLWRNCFNCRNSRRFCCNSWDLSFCFTCWCMGTKQTIFNYWETCKFYLFFIF